MPEEITITTDSVDEESETEVMEIEEWRVLLESTVSSIVNPLKETLSQIQTQMQVIAERIPDSNLLARLLEVNANQNQAILGSQQTTQELLIQRASETEPIAEVEVIPEPVAEAAPEEAQTEITAEEKVEEKARPKRVRI